jgi:hypothetical protein
MHKMSDYLSDLPTELIEKILDHISTVDILSSLCLVNRRLYSVSLIYSRFSLDFNSIAKKKKQFDLLHEALSNFRSRIASLTFDNNDNKIRCEKSIRFLYSIPVNRVFPNLHSITFNKINSNVWPFIRVRLPSSMALRSMSRSMRIFHRLFRNLERIFSTKPCGITLNFTRIMYKMEQSGVADHRDADGRLRDVSYGSL